ncbi:MAG: hypothetical protein C4523_01745 [Myxococcales bacterium]|nr:MAG: hypothetical protein C4523_01745 [Myxococcales bacterium]
MRESRLYLATRIDRFWHWVHAVGVVLLILSGFNIHFAESFDVLGGIERAIWWHNVVGVIVAFDWGLWLIYNLATRRIRYYLPTADEKPAGLLRQARFYLFGLFRNDPHPYAITAERKFNPLQKLTYLGMMALVVPFQIVTGIYMLLLISGSAEFGGKMFLPSVLHTAGAFATTAFLVGHVYLATTGRRPYSHFAFMISGYHEEDHLPEGGSP